MRAIRVSESGTAEVLRLQEVERPEPGGGEVLVEVALAGVNYADIGQRAGMIGGPHAVELPYTPGFEVAGRVVEVGRDVEGIEEGDRIVAAVDSGGYAEYARVSGASVVKVPDRVDYLSATALLVQGLTAYGTLHDAAGLREGESVLVQAAAGGVGSLALQLARLAGAGAVFGTVGSEDKFAPVEALGAVAVNYSENDWVERVLEGTGGRGVDVILECVGGERGGRCYECLAPLGRLVSFGAASGEVPRAPDMWQLNLKGQSVIGYGGPWIRTGAAGTARQDIGDYLQSGLRVLCGGRYPLREAAEAHRTMEERRTVGKIVLEP